jgi:hypothetical protein
MWHTASGSMLAFAATGAAVVAVTGPAAVASTSGFSSKTVPSLQAVAMPTLDPSYVYYEQAWGTMRTLEPDMFLYGPWFVYPRYAIQSLWPMSPHLCGHLNGDSLRNNWTTTLVCAEGTVAAVEAAWWGLPAGFCGAFRQNNTACTTNVSAHVAEKCVGQKRCTIVASPSVLGRWPAGCAAAARGGRPMALSVQLRCSVPQNFTSWDTAALDGVTQGFFGSGPEHAALGWGGHPNWLYRDGFSYTEKDYELVPDDYFDSNFHYEQGRILRDPTGNELGDYYGRSLAHYINGGFTDEAGRWHAGYRYNISIFQSINEPEAEHRCNYSEYTHRYDAIIEGIWRHADPGRKLEFLLGQLSGHREWDWYHYMLNSSNHRAGIPIDWLSYHFYASCELTDGSMETLFSQADDFLDEVRQIQEIISLYTPTSVTKRRAKNYIDEIGCFAPVGPATMNPSSTLYWNACAGMYAYLFGHFSVIGGATAVAPCNLSF